MKDDFDDTNDVEAEAILKMVDRLKANLFEDDDECIGLPLEVADLSWWDRMKARFWGFRNISYLLDQNMATIHACTHLGKTPGEGSPAYQLSCHAFQLEVDLEIHRDLLETGVKLTSAAREIIEDMAKENSGFRQVIKQTVSDLERVQSQSKVLRSVKANLTSALVNAANDDEQMSDDEQVA